jgi:hypothetical protein
MKIKKKCNYFRFIRHLSNKKQFGARAIIAQAAVNQTTT